MRQSREGSMRQDSETNMIIVLNTALKYKIPSRKRNYRQTHTKKSIRANTSQNCKLSVSYGEEFFWKNDKY